VRQEGGRYYLTSPDLTACGTEDEAWKVAERIVDHVNSAIRLVEPSFRPVRVEALNHMEPDGTQRGSVRVSFDAVVVARERMTAVVTRADGTVETITSPDSSFVPKLVRLQEREAPDSPVSRALKQWNLPEQNPTSLNKILEIIRDDIWGGDPKNKDREAWETMARTMAPAVAMSEAQLDDELRRCRNSLQSEAAVGAHARHASSRRIANPMNLREAEVFVHGLLLAWLRRKV
jgi:hypothetical protein